METMNKLGRILMVEDDPKDVELTLTALEEYNLANEVVVARDGEQALDYALAKAAPNDAVFITGSLYLVGQLRHYWKQRAQVATR